MIDTNETGNRKLKALSSSLGAAAWTEWEENFIQDMEGKRYEDLTPKQQTTVSNLWEKL